jgi:hypothetical protein
MPGMERMNYPDGPLPTIGIRSIRRRGTTRWPTCPRTSVPGGQKRSVLVEVVAGPTRSFGHPHGRQACSTIQLSSFPNIW